MGLKAVVIERLGGYGGSFIGTEGMTGLETKYTSGENCPVFAGAYNPTAPYGVKNALNTCLNYHHWIPSHKLHEAYFGQMKEIIDWLEGHGIVFADSIAIGAGPKIWHVYDKGNDASPGGHFMQCFGAEAERLGTEARFNTFGRQLIMENGKVVGLLAEDEEGQVIPDLYAGGSDAGGLYGDSYDVKFAPGSQAGWAVNSGCLAVKDAKEYPRQVAYSAGQRLP